MPDNVLPSTAPDGRFEQVLAELLQAEERGERADLAQVVRNCPELETPLREFFHARDGFDRLAPQLAPPAAGTSPPASPPATRLPGYEILEELGRGGMGIVYRARQLNPNRLVALKVIRMDRLESLTDDERRQWLERFRREAQTVASFDQPDQIVTLYESGEHHGQAYFTMRLVSGGTLAQRLKQGPLAQREAAGLLAQVARAVHYAHQRGVLHRDLKPANVLLDEQGRPLVGDFGLARRLDHTGSLVASGIEGTASYMAPEQAAAAPGAATTAADVYSLGAILYECLTARPPFKGKSDVETLLLVLRQEPPRPRALNPRLNRDLETICLKCLHREPGRRYASAAALAEDLDNWLLGRPINARPAGAAERLWRWCRRNPVPTAAAATVLAVAVAAFVLIADSRNKAWGLAQANEQVARKNEKLAADNGQLAREKTKEATRAREKEKEAQHEAIQMAFQQAMALCDQGEIGRGMHLFAKSVDLAGPAGETDLERAARANLAAWHAHLHRLRAALPHAGGVGAVAFSPDGRTLATASFDHTARLWDSATGRLIGPPLRHGAEVRALAFSPDGKRVLTAAPQDRARPAQLWDAATGEPVGGSLRQPGEAHVVAFSPDGRVALTAGVEKDGPNRGRGVVQLWNAASGEPVGQPLVHERRVQAAAFGPDGRALLTASMDAAYLWDVATGKLVRASILHDSYIHALAFGPGGRFFVTAGHDGSACVWDTATGRKVLAAHHTGPVEAVAVSPDGRMMVTGSRDKTAQLWDLAPGKSRGAPLPHQGPVAAVAFSPDGRTVATGSWDGTVRLWDAGTGRAIGQPLPHGGEVLALAFGPDGRTVLAGCGRKEGDARLWGLAAGERAGPTLAHRGSVLAVAFSPDGRRVVTAGQDDTARLWDARTGEPIGAPLRHTDQVNAAVFTPDGRTVITASDDDSALYWDAATGKPLMGDRRRVYVAQYLTMGGFRHRLGAILAAASGPMNALPLLRLGMNDFTDWNFARLLAREIPYQLRLDHESELWKGLRNRGSTRHAGFSGKGRQNDEVWGPAKGRRPWGLNDRGPFAINALAVSPDGRTVVTAGANRAIKLWSDGILRARLALNDKDLFIANAGLGDSLNPADSVYVAAFRPDGRVVVTAGGNKEARLWDAATGRPVGGPMVHEGPVVAVAFSPDGKVLLTGSADRTARLWDAATGRAVGQPLRHQGEVVAVAFSPNGRTLVTGSWDRTARVWETASGQLFGPPLVHQGKVLAVAFGPDGRTVLTGSEDGTARLWDGRTGKPIGPPLRHRDEVRAVAFSPDGRSVVTGSDDDTARLWAVPPPVGGDAEQVLVWSQVHTGLRLDPDGAPRVLAPLDWQKSRVLLFLAGGRPPAHEEALAWHRCEAAACERDGQWLGALWHLDRLVEAAPDSWRFRTRRGNALAELGRWDQALADLTAAVEQAPEEWEPWHNRGKAFVARGEWQKGVDDLSEVLHRKPDHGPSWHYRGFARGGLAGWKQASDDLRRAMNERDAPADAWSHYAILRLHIQDTDGYRSACTGLQSKFTAVPNSIKFGVSTAGYGLTEVIQAQKPFDPVSAATVLWTCALAPDAVGPPVPFGGPVLGQITRSGPGPDHSSEIVYVRPERGLYTPLVHLAQRAAAEFPGHYPTARACGAMLYRAGLYEAAVNQLTAAALLRREPSPSVWIFLAMAHHRLGHREEARKWLNQAAGWIDQAAGKGAGAGRTDPLPWDRLPWNERVALQVLRREAEQLVLGKEPTDAFDAAVAYDTEAVRLDPNDTTARYNLGVTLQRKGDLAAAVAAFRVAVRIDPKFAPGHAALGITLTELGALEEAVAAYRKAVHINPNFAEAHCNLGLCLMRQGKLAEALAELRRGHELGSRLPGWPYPSAAWVGECERLGKLEGRLEPVVRGEVKPGDAERIDFARLLYCKGQYALAARFYEEALAARPELAGDLKAQHRDNAARAAALAACGQGKNAAADERARAHWRKQALGYLEADLQLWARQLRADAPQARGQALAALRRWQRDPDLAGLRGEAALAKLPRDEQVAWRRFWAEVDRLTRPPGDRP